MAKETSLTTGEQRKLVQHETTIKNGLHSFVEVGKALISIRDEKLYTDVDGTFEGYCNKRWGLSKPRAYQLIDSARVVDVVSTIGGPAPDNERQARVLAALPDEQTQATVWAKAVETAPKGSDGEPKVTAAHVKKVADEMSPKMPGAKPAAKREPEKPKAETEPEGGYEPHEALKPIGKLDDVFTRAMEHHAAVLKILGKSEPLVAEIHAGLDAAYRAMTKLRTKLQKTK